MLNNQFKLFKLKVKRLELFKMAKGFKLIHDIYMLLDFTKYVLNSNKHKNLIDKFKPFVLNSKQVILR